MLIDSVPCDAWISSDLQIGTESCGLLGGSMVDSRRQIARRRGLAAPDGHPEGYRGGLSLRSTDA